jgi:serine/threonine-protein kinase
MSTDRWRQIEELCHGALGVSTEQRTRFIDQACGGDSALREEVESLIAQEPHIAEFLSRPAGMIPPLDAPATSPGQLAGLRLGSYQIRSLLGAGGMGEVYRAFDDTLGREVAIKVLPPALTADAEWRLRFEREARVLASLNHPHIGSIFGVEEGPVSAPEQPVDGPVVRALVLELVEGETLAERLARTTRIPFAEALAIARQIADALEAAHERNIVHCDLKPGNIKLTSDTDCTVKVLDFGLAQVDPTASELKPRDGAFFGTAAYMSPEYARGSRVDKRSDIWAFGCVLYEMVTGHLAFGGETISATIANVLEREPDWTALPPDTPVALRQLLGRCLVKNSKQRSRDIGDVRIEIDAILDSGARRSEPPPDRLISARVALVAFGCAALAMMLGLALWPRSRTASTTSPLRLNADLGADAALEDSITFRFGDAAALSPDGSTIAFVAKQNGTDLPPQLYVRRLDQLRAARLPGTDDALSPFFSPDGTWIGFFSGPKLKKVPAAGGAVEALADVLSPRGGSWGADGTIVFSPNNLSGTRLLRVSSAGGNAEPLLPLSAGETVQGWPQILPGGKALLYTSSNNPGAFDDATLVVQPLPTGAPKTVHRGGYHGRYLPSGHLVYINNGTLFAARFDVSRMEIAGHPMPILEGVRSNSLTGGSQFAIADNGTLIYLPGPSIGAGTPMKLTARNGATTPIRFPPVNWFDILFSPDGQRLAMQIRNKTSDIWVYDLSREALTRVTQDLGANAPVWTLDGQAIVFSSARADNVTPNLYWQRADGTGEAIRLTASRYWHRATSWHPSGKFLAFEEVQDANVNVMILPVEGTGAGGLKAGKPTPLLNGPYIEGAPMFSPDGRWIAYTSNESGRAEVYVRAFPGPGGKWQVSTEGGSHPTWSRTKQELVYGVGGQIMVADYQVVRTAFRSEKPRLWSEVRYDWRGPRRMFDLHPDGERLVLAPSSKSASDGKSDKMVFVFNFFDQLSRTFATDGR